MSSHQANSPHSHGHDAGHTHGYDAGHTRGHDSGTEAGSASARIIDRLSPGGRLIGLDAARGIALLAMMVTHIFALAYDTGMPTWAAIFAGRASALFAVLAGCSLVLSTRSRLDAAHPGRGRLRDAAPSVLIRAAAIVLIGLCLGSISSLLAVILVNYGIMFALALFFLRLRAGTLFAIAGVWMLLSPVVSMWVRSELGLEPNYLPMGFFDFATPGTMFTDLFFTGYYPVLQWLSYILLGMAVAKLDIGRHLLGLFVLGLSLFVASRGVSWLLLNVFGGDATLVEVSQMWGTDLTAALFTGSYGVTPATSWWWLAIAGPHSGTPFDLLSTGGTAVMTIVACQAAAKLLGRRSWVLAPLSAPGSMPLSVYSAHVVLLEITRPALIAEPWNGPGTVAEQTTEFTIHALTFIAIPLLWKMFVNPRGPFEGGIAAIIRATSTRSAGSGSGSVTSANNP